MFGDFCKGMTRWHFVPVVEVYVICNSFILPLCYRETISPPWSEFSELMCMAVLSCLRGGVLRQLAVPSGRWGGEKASGLAVHPKARAPVSQVPGL